MPRSAISAALLAAGLAVVTLGVPVQAQPAAGAPTPGPYAPVAIKLPVPLEDASFVAFRKQLAAIAQRRDRAALARLLVRTGFFWERPDGDAADKKKSAFANFAAAIGLDDADDPDTGWDTIAIYAQDPTVAPLRHRPGVVCGPADPDFDVAALQALIDRTQTDVSDWVYPLTERLALLAEPRDDAPIVETVGPVFVRILPVEAPLDTAAAEFVRVLAPSGRSGFVRVDGLASLGVSQICYVKDGGAWRITGVVGDAEQP